MHCPYEQIRVKHLSRCRILMAACGFVTSVSSGICAACIKGKEWNKGGVPQLEADAEERTPSEADAMKIVRGSDFFTPRYKGFLHARLLGGDCPRYQSANPVNMSVAFRKYIDEYGREDAEELLLNMLDRQLQKAEEEREGCDSESVVRDKIAILAEEHNLVTPTEARQLRGEIF